MIYAGATTYRFGAAANYHLSDLYLCEGSTAYLNTSSPPARRSLRRGSQVNAQLSWHNLLAESTFRYFKQQQHRLLSRELQVLRRLR